MITDDRMYNFSYQPLIFVCRNEITHNIQVLLAAFNFTHALLFLLVETHDNGTSFLHEILRVQSKFFLEMITTLPLIFSFFFPKYKNLFVPIFLNIWLAKRELVNLLVKKKSPFRNQLFVIGFTIVSLIITCVLGINHLERAGENPANFDLINSLWFVMVTFATVGYGDITPTTWLSKMFVILIIVYLFLKMPVQIEKLTYIWRHQQTTGGSFSPERSTRHVILCATEFRLDRIADFLNEFFANNNHKGGTEDQRYVVILLTPAPRSPEILAFLELSGWSNNVTYLQGSCMSNGDLSRAKTKSADACFILTCRTAENGEEEDEKTILRAMAVKSFAPDCPLFVHVLKIQSKFKVSFANQIICDEEFMYSMFALNSYIPGISTAMVLLSHTASRISDTLLQEIFPQSAWERFINHSVDLEIYDTTLKESKVFSSYADESFSVMCYQAYKKFQIMAIAINRRGKMMVAPGKAVRMKPDDVIYYISAEAEENTVLDHTLADKRHSIFNLIETEWENENLLEKSDSFMSEHEVGYEISEKGHYEVTVSGNNNNLIANPKKQVVPESGKKQSHISFQGLPEKDDNDEPHTVNNYTINFPPFCPVLQRTNLHVMCYLTSKYHEDRFGRRHSVSPAAVTSLMSSHHRELLHGLHYKPEFLKNKKRPIIVVCEQGLSLSVCNLIINLRAVIYFRPSELIPVVIITPIEPSRKVLNALSSFPLVYRG